MTPDRQDGVTKHDLLPLLHGPVFVQLAEGQLLLSHLEGEEGLLLCFSRGEFEVIAQAVTDRPCGNFPELWDCTLKSSRGHWKILLDLPKDDVVQLCWGLPWSSRLSLGHPRGYLIDYPGCCSLANTEDCCNICLWHACLMQLNDALFLSCAWFSKLSHYDFYCARQLVMK